MSNSSTSGSRSRRWLRWLALDRRETFCWALYDTGSSAFITTIVGVILPIYYASVAASELPDHIASAYWGYTSSLGLLIIALFSPILGAVADYMGAKKRFMALFVTIGVIFTALLYFVTQGEWVMASALFIMANLGYAGANIFYDSLLPHIVSPEEVDRLSTAGYALGYLGGGALLVLNMLWILQPEMFGIADEGTASRLSMFSVAIWWAIFSVPIGAVVPEPPRRVGSLEQLGMNPLSAGFARLQDTFQQIRQYRQLLIFLIAFLFYNDGIGTIVKMATIYGVEVGIEQGDLIGAFVLAQFVSFPATLFFGWLAQRIGPRGPIYIGLIVYTCVSIGAYFMSEGWHFWLLAVGIAMVQGGTQALSRSLYSSMVPRSRSSEFFGFFSVSTKFAGIMGPLIFGLVSQQMESSRLSIVSVLIFFIGGMLILSQVDIEEGQRVAREEERKFKAI